MALYVTRPRRDEVRIGRGLPSGPLAPWLKSVEPGGIQTFLCSDWLILSQHYDVCTKDSGRFCPESNCSPPGPSDAEHSRAREPGYVMRYESAKASRVRLASMSHRSMMKAYLRKPISIKMGREKKSEVVINAFQLCVITRVERRYNFFLIRVELDLRLFTLRL